MNTASSRPLETLRIAVRPSPATNDHEVLLSTEDGCLVARFADDGIGVDPDDLLIAPSPLQSDAATIARCVCGAPGCGDVTVAITRVNDIVSWTTKLRRVGVSFDAVQYDREVARALHDFSWETPGRTAARLIRSGVDHEALRAHGLHWQWASHRIAKHTITLSLEHIPGPFQILLDVAWTDGDPNTIAAKCIELLATPPRTWSDARWVPNPAASGPPSVAGPGWTPVRVNGR